MNTLDTSNTVATARQFIRDAGQDDEGHGDRVLTLTEEQVRDLVTWADAALVLIGQLRQDREFNRATIRDLRGATPEGWEER